MHCLRSDWRTPTLCGLRQLHRAACSVIPSTRPTTLKRSDGAQGAPVLEVHLAADRCAVLRRHRATPSGCVNATLTALGPQLTDERFPSIACDGIVDRASVGTRDGATIPLPPCTQISQAQSTHYRSRPRVDRHRFGENSRQPHVAEAVSEKGGGTFRSQSLAPEIRQESIPQFYLSPLVLVGRCEEPPADEDFSKKPCPEAETVSSRADAFLMVPFNFRPLSRFASTEVTHNARMCVQSDLVFEVLVSQRNESQPATGARSAPIRSISTVAGTAMSITCGCSRGSDWAAARCTSLRRSTIDRNANTLGGLSESAMISLTWTSDRRDSGDGTRGEITRSAACNAFSATKDAPGGQSPWSPRAHLVVRPRAIWIGRGHVWLQSSGHDSTHPSGQLLMLQEPRPHGYSRHSGNTCVARRRSSAPHRQNRHGM